MDLRSKLQLPEGVGVNIIHAPRGLELDLPVGRKSSDAILFFAKDSTALKGARSVFAAAKKDRLCWVAYPKAGQLGTDLNRDKLWALLKRKGIEPVRAVSLDETWTALRFRPAE